MNFDFFMKVLRYGGGSVLAVGVDFALLLLLESVFGFPYLFAAGFAFTAGCVVKYLASKYLVYEDNRGDDKAKSIVLFIGFAFLGLATNQIIMFVGVEYLGVHFLVAKLFSAAFVFVMNFFLLGLFVFKDPLLTKQD